MLKLKIVTDSEAFNVMSPEDELTSGGPGSLGPVLATRFEIYRILHDIASRIIAGERDMTLTDRDGNEVGQARLTD